MENKQYSVDLSKLSQEEIEESVKQTKLFTNSITQNL